ncbi:MAG: bifunctional riboflavin kinase/FAD synthetase [Firmicutes bacterium]|nr:bifunctional riboflavin kinase/FAD synthetase [Bacillota bacterium]
MTDCSPQPADLRLTLSTLRARAPLFPLSSIAVGNFDGVHVGHRRILETAAKWGARCGAAVVALTFDPHPQAVVGRGSPPALGTLDERLAQLRSAGARTTVCLRFDEELARLPARAFAEEVLKAGLGAAHVAVGFNFRFGHRAEGTVDLLKQIGLGSGFAVHAVGPVRVDGQVVSSSLIRERLSAGDVEGAARLLGRPYRLSGLVRTGERRGRTLGFPTANVEPRPGLVVPGEGVYRVRFAAGSGPDMAAVAVIGTRPTFGGRTLSLEVHVLDFHGDLYGQPAEVAFLDRIRGVSRFRSADELRRQIELDVKEARRRFKAEQAAPARP